MLPLQKAVFSGEVVDVHRLIGVLPMSRSKAWLDTHAETEALTPHTSSPTTAASTWSWYGSEPRCRCACGA